MSFNNREKGKMQKHQVQEFSSLLVPFLTATGISLEKLLNYKCPHCENKHLIKDCQKTLENLKTLEGCLGVVFLFKLAQKKKLKINENSHFWKLCDDDEFFLNAFYFSESRDYEHEKIEVDEICDPEIKRMAFHQLCKSLNGFHTRIPKKSGFFICAEF